MRLTNLATVLMLLAAPALVRADFQCTKDNVVEFTPSQLEKFLNITKTVENIMVAKMKNLTITNQNNGTGSSTEPSASVSSSAARFRKLRKRQTEMKVSDDLKCKDGQKCVMVERRIDCFDEKTSTLYAIEGHQVTSLNLLNGDFVLPNGVKSNAYTNTKPIEDFAQYMYDLREKFPYDSEEAEEEDKTTEVENAKASPSGPNPVESQKETEKTEKNEEKNDDKNSAAVRVIMEWVAGVAAFGVFLVLA